MATPKKRKAHSDTGEHEPGKMVASKPVYPGFKHWKTKTSRLKNATMSETSAYESKSGSFVQTIKVKHDDAFRLKPLTFTEGPLKGHHILLLEPSTDHFPFLDLPAEIRQMIYDECFLDERGTSISQLKRRGHAHRVVSHGRLLGTSARWNGSKATWTNKPPSALGLLTANKQIWDEVSSTIYGNTFHFPDFKTCQTFLEQIGTMRSLLRDVVFEPRAYQTTKARTVFFKLREAKRLRSLTIHFLEFASKDSGSGGVSIATFAADCKTMMVSLHKSRKTQEDLPVVLDLVHFTSQCSDCWLSSRGTTPWPKHDCECERLKPEYEAAQKDFRGFIADYVGIQDAAAQKG
ncbi:hypothetical protein CBER1_00504 [Cercospora berteroae]|uniref:F-box domain-containing protein n=1 Tax=Cercospora berteroae TaxID=357750 RepID=A0A2S6CB39_9PEZI|nr:hypothetical protein CBER1_00504 [Cercospora berteroae]